MNEIEIRKDYVPGAIGRIIEMHGAYYHEHWGFGAYFEAKVAGGLAELLNRYDAERDGIWTVSVNGRVEGAIAIDGLHATEAGAHLRWFIVSDVLRGQGMGRRLIDIAVDFCRSRQYPRVFLWTFEGLLAARQLYDQLRFVIVEQHPGNQWGTEVMEQRFELQLDG